MLQFVHTMGKIFGQSQVDHKNMEIFHLYLDLRRHCKEPWSKTGRPKWIDKGQAIDNMYILL